jgi:thiol-disulfide isomerase/thioredoxin
MDPIGVVAIAAVLLLGVAVGLWRRRTDGRFRDVAGSAAPATMAPARTRSGELRQLALAPDGRATGAFGEPGVVGDTTGAFGEPGVVGDRSAATETGSVDAGREPVGGAESQRRVVPDGREEPGVIAEPGTDPAGSAERLDPALLQELGVGEASATLLQFSSAFCAPCRAVRRVSSEVAAMVPGVQHVEVDAESHLEAVRALGIWRTPTLLVLDAEGRVAKRATGVPGKPQLIAALGAVL